MKADRHDSIQFNSKCCLDLIHSIHTTQALMSFYNITELLLKVALNSITPKSCIICHKNVFQYFFLPFVEKVELKEKSNSYFNVLFLSFIFFS